MRTNPTKVEAEQFFESLNQALKAPTPTQASPLVTPSKRAGFEFAYQLWRDCRFFDVEVAESRLDEDILRVFVSFECPSGTKDRETKTLQRSEGAWRLNEY